MNTVKMFWEHWKAAMRSGQRNKILYVVLPLTMVLVIIPTFTAITTSFVFASFAFAIFPLISLFLLFMCIRGVGEIQLAKERGEGFKTL